MCRSASGSSARATHDAWSTLAPAIARSPLWCAQQYPLGLERLARAELLETVYAGDQPAVDHLLAQMRVSNLQEPLLAWATDWAGRHGGTEPPLEHNAPRIDRRHPFIEELNKEGFNLLGDFEVGDGQQGVSRRLPDHHVVGCLGDARPLARLARSAIARFDQRGDRPGDGARQPIAADDDPRVRTDSACCRSARR